MMIPNSIPSLLCCFPIPLKFLSSKRNILAKNTWPISFHLSPKQKNTDMHDNGIALLTPTQISDDYGIALLTPT